MLKLLASLFLLITLGMAQGAYAGPKEDAFAAFSRKDYATALSLLRPLATQGDAWAQFTLGIFYQYGQGVVEDHKEAVKWYRLAAAQGNVAAAREIASAQRNLGKMAQDKNAGPYKDGEAAFERRDFATALSLWRPLAAQGNAWAQVDLGLMYDRGQGVVEDSKEAVKWYRLAAAQGLEMAQQLLGNRYYYGMGVDRDYVRAHMWYNMLASNGYSDASNKEAVKWYQKNLDNIAKSMTSAQIAQAQEMAQRCQASSYQQCD